MAGTEMNESEFAEPKKTPAKPVFLGCGIGCLAIIVLFIIFSFLAVRWGIKHVRAMTEEFVNRGFIVVSGQPTEKMLTITEKVTKPTLFIGQEIDLTNGADAEVAVVGGKVTLHGTFTEKVYYRGGGDLTVAADANLMKGLDAQAKAVHLLGRVQCEITGKISQLQKKEFLPTSTTSAPSP